MTADLDSARAELAGNVTEPPPVSTAGRSFMAANADAAGQAQRLRTFVGEAVEITDRKVAFDLGELVNGPGLQEVTGLRTDVTGYRLTVDNNALRHIHSRRGFSLTADDIGRIPEIVSSPDSVTKAVRTSEGRLHHTVRFGRRFGDEAVTVVAEALTRKKELAVKTMWKDKIGGEAAAVGEAGEQVTAAAIEVNGERFLGPDYYHEAIDKAVAKLGRVLTDEDVVREGWITSTGRFVDSREAALIEGVGDLGGEFLPVPHFEDIRAVRAGAAIR